MSITTRRGREASAADPATFNFGDHGAFDALDAGERISPPKERGSSMLGATLVLLVLFGSGWAIWQAPADWLARLGVQVDALSALVRDPSAAAATSDPSSIATAELGLAAQPLEPVGEQQASMAADAAVPPDAVTIETGAIADPAQSAEAEPQPLPPVRVDPADPYQRRAVAVGLHPDLSRVLLSRLSAADYRNAGYAIDTAIAKTSDDANFVWPLQRKPEQALFRVHFVPGAVPQCRRYVVTVVKDGWTTTASPMERCGAQLAGAKRAPDPEGPSPEGVGVSGR